MLKNINISALGISKPTSEDLILSLVFHFRCIVLNIFNIQIKILNELLILFITSKILNFKLIIFTTL